MWISVLLGWGQSWCSQRWWAVRWALASIPLQVHSVASDRLSYFCSRLLNAARVKGGQVGCEDKVEQELLVAAPGIWAVGLLSFFPHKLVVLYGNGSWKRISTVVSHWVESSSEKCSELPKWVFPVCIGLFSEVLCCNCCILKRKLGKEAALLKDHLAMC